MPTVSRIAACSPDAAFTQAGQLLGQGMGCGRCFLEGPPFRLRVQLWLFFCSHVPPAGTLAFWAPELIAGEAPAASADIWAGATTAWALATGTMPPSVETLHFLKYPEVSQWPGSDAFGPLFLAWLEATLATTDRASATKALQLDWLQEAHALHTLLPPAPAPPVAAFQPKNENNSKFLRRVAPKRALANTASSSSER